MIKFRLLCPKHGRGTAVEMSEELVEGKTVDILGYLERAAEIALLQLGCAGDCRPEISRVVG